MKTKILILMGILLLINVSYAYDFDSVYVGVGYNATKITEEDLYWSWSNFANFFVKSAHCGNLSLTLRYATGNYIYLYVLEEDKEWTIDPVATFTGYGEKNVNFTAPYGIFRLSGSVGGGHKINKTSTIVPLEENYTYMTFDEGEKSVDLPFVNKYDNHTTEIYVYGDSGSDLFYGSETKGAYQWVNSNIPCELVSSTGQAQVLVINKNKDNSSQNQMYKYYIYVNNFNYPTVTDTLPLTNITYEVPIGGSVTFISILNDSSGVDYTAYYLNGEFIEAKSGYQMGYTYTFDESGEYIFTTRYAFGCDRYMSINWSIEVVGEEVCISGKVMASHDFSDISNAYVNLYNNETGQLLETTTTDYSGEYELSCYSRNLTVKVVVSHPEYETDEESIKLSDYAYGEARLQHYLNKKGYLFSIPFYFVDSDTAADINNFSIKLEKNDYTKILDIRNLTLYQKYNCEYNITNNTIEIYNLTEGIYSIDVSAPEYEKKHYDIELHPLIPFFIFYLKNISGMNRWNITGYVYDTYNNTVSDIVVELYKYPAYSSTPEIEETTVTDASGYFEFLNISEGMKMIYISSTMYQTYSEIFNLNENKFFNITLNYSINQIYIHGIVTDCFSKTPLTFVDVTFVNKDNGNNYTTITDYSGEYEIYIPPGKYGVVIEKEGYEPDTGIFTYDIDRDKTMNFCLFPEEELYDLKIKIYHDGDGYLNPLVTIYDKDKNVITEDYCEKDVFLTRLEKGSYYIGIKKEGYKVKEDLSEPINLYSHKTLTYTLIIIEGDLDDAVKDIEELMDDLHIPRNEADFLSWFRGWGYVILFFILMLFFLFILLSITSEISKRVK